MGFDKEPGDEHSSFKEHNWVVMNFKFSKEHTERFCVSERRGAPKK